MITEPQKQNPHLTESLRFSVYLLNSTAMLYIHKLIILKISHNASILYDERCLSSYDPILCGSLYIKKEVGNLFETTVNKVGGVFMLALILTATAKATGMVYRKFAKNKD